MAGEPQSVSGRCLGPLLGHKWLTQNGNLNQPLSTAIGSSPVEMEKKSVDVIHQIYFIKVPNEICR